ncbi:Rrf2 family transcriptional regulator [Desulfovibrio sp. OttesenSCG-928-A18]|nr:Rrf2 family transcriptional regulator [Desulfovibrio sp. OttesenSCG-928-A18]
MKLSARSRYASRILLELAREKSATPVSAATLSQHTGVSVQFVEQILKPLKQSGLTKSVRGAAGGHRLAKPAEEITLGEVVRLMEEGILLTVCCGDKANECPRRDGCLTRRAWMQVSKSLEQELDSISIASLLQGDLVCPEGQDKIDAQKLKLAKAAPIKKEIKPHPGKNPRVITRKARVTRSR